MANFFADLMPSLDAPRSPPRSAGDFVEQYLPALESISERIGVSPRVLAAQFGHETGWGKGVPGSNNLGNIKDFSGGGTQAYDRLEGSNDRYRNYSSPQDFADDFVRLIESRYPKAIGAGDDPVKFASALKAGGYATDPAYVQKVANAYGIVPDMGRGGGGREPGFFDDLISSARAAPPKPEKPIKYIPYDEFIAQQKPANDIERGELAQRWMDTYGGMEKPAPTSLWTDIKNTFSMGFQGLALDAREIARRVIGDDAVAVIDRADEFWHGKTSEKLIKDNIEKSKQALSPEMRDALDKKWWDDKGDTFGEAWSDPRAYLGGLTQSAPGTLITMVPGLGMARGVYSGGVLAATGAATVAAGEKMMMASAAGQDLLKRIAARAATTAAIAGGTLEGLQQAGQTGREVREAILGMDQAKLADSEALQSLMATGLNFEQARAKLAEDASAQAMTLAGVATGVFGGMGDRIMARAFTKGLSGNLATRIAKGAAAEGLLEEAPQGYLSKIGENIGMQQAVPSTPTTQGALNEALGGAVVGGLMGGGMATFSRRQPDQPPPAQQPAPTTPPNTPTVTPEQPQARPLNQTGGEFTVPEDVYRAAAGGFDTGLRASFSNLENAPNVDQAVQAAANVALAGIPAASTDMDSGVTNVATLAAIPEPAKDSLGFVESFSSMGKQISESFYNQAYEALRAGKGTISGVKDQVLSRAKPAFDAGLIASPDDIRKFEQEGYPSQPEPTAIQLAMQRAREKASRATGAQNTQASTTPTENQNTQQKQQVTESIQPQAIAGEWRAFPNGSGTLGVPRADMPQIKAEHRGPMVNFLEARGITHQQEEVPASTLKATQAEYSPAKVEKAKQFDGGDRSILISSDNHILDGHHQAIAKAQSGEPIKVIRLNAPIRELLPVVSRFPSATTDQSSEANNAGATRGNVDNPPAPANAAPGVADAGGSGVRGTGMPVAGRGAENPTGAVAPAAEALKPLVEGLINRRRAAQEIGRERAFNAALDKAKQAMAGADIKPGVFKTYAKTLAGDPRAVELLGRIADAVESGKVGNGQNANIPNDIERSGEPENYRLADINRSNDAVGRGVTIAPEPESPNIGENFRAGRRVDGQSGELSSGVANGQNATNTAPAVLNGDLAAGNQGLPASGRGIDQAKNSERGDGIPQPAQAVLQGGAAESLAPSQPPQTPSTEGVSTSTELRPDPKPAAPVGFAAIVQREINAENRFIDSAVEQFGLTREQAGNALSWLVKENVVQIDPIGGQFTLKDGRFWDRDVLLRAADQRQFSRAGAVENARSEVILQNRDRSSAASIAQMQSIASNPDPARLSFSRDMASGAPVVFFDGNPVGAVTGRRDSVTTSTGRKINVTYAAIEADNLLASNFLDGSTNAEYANTQQDKARAIAGNGRLAGIKGAYDNGNAKGYVEGIAGDDALHGVPSSAIRGMKNPILVRIMDAGDVTANIGDESNVAMGAALDPIEQARTDMRRVKLESLDFSEDGGLSMDAVRRFVQAMPAVEQAGLMGRDGSPTRQAVDRLTAAIFAQAYADDSLTALASQAIDPEAKSVISALTQAAPSMIKLEGAQDLDIRGAVRDAAKSAINARRNGVKLDKWLAQGDIEMTDDTRVIAGMFVKNLRSAKAMAEWLIRKAEFAYNESTKAGFDMFGEVERANRSQVLGMLDDTARQENLEQPAGRKPDGSNGPQAVVQGEQADVAAAGAVKQEGQGQQASQEVEQRRATYSPAQADIFGGETAKPTDEEIAQREERAAVDRSAEVPLALTPSAGAVTQAAENSPRNQRDMFASLAKPDPTTEAATALKEAAQAIKEVAESVKAMADKQPVPQDGAMADSGVKENASENNGLRDTGANDENKADGETGIAEQRKPAYNSDQQTFDFDRVYDNIETRPGTRDVQRRLGIAALRGLFAGDRRAGASILGSALWKGFTERAGADLIGQPVASADDLALAAQVLRDPRFETLRVFFVKDGKVVGHTGWTTRMPASVTFGTDGGAGFQARIDELNAQRVALNADGYYLMHNHPSGTATPSNADEALTIRVAKSMPDFLGHVVLDHNEYALIDKNGTSVEQRIQGTADPAPEVAHDTLGMKISMASELVAVAKTLTDGRKGYATLIATNASGRVQAISEVPESLLLAGNGKQTLRAIARVRRFLNGTGSAGQAFLVAENPDRFDRLIWRGVLQDVVNATPGSNGRHVARSEQGVYGSMRYRENKSIFGVAQDAPKFSIRDGIGERIDAALRGEVQDTPIYLGQTPAVLQRLGMKNLPVAMDDSVVDKAVYDHGVTASELKKIAEAIADPVAVLDSESKNAPAGSLVVVTDMVKADGRPIIVAVHPGDRVNRVEINNVASVYPKDNAQSTLARWSQNLLRYVNNEKRPGWQRSTGVQFSYKMPAQGADRIVLTDADIVKSDRSISFTNHPFGDAKLSRRNGIGGMALADLEATIARVRKAYKNLPDIIALESPKQAPSALRDDIRKVDGMDTVEAVYDNGKIYAFSDNIANAFRAEHVIFKHELTHYGFRGVFGNEAAATLNGLYMRNKALREQAQSVRKQFRLGSDIEAVEEVLAEMKDSELVQLKGIDRLISFMRDWFARHGFDKLAERMDAMLRNRNGDDLVDAAMVGDIVRASREWAKSGKQTNETRMYMAGTAFAPAYHGTPYDFDRFSLDKIGTGEGAQAYGWGLYFAESKDVADRYKNTLTHYNAKHVKSKLMHEGVSEETADAFANYYASVGRGRDPYVSFAEETSKPHPSKEFGEPYRARIRTELPKLKVAVDKIDGSLYTVDIPDEAVARFLDWDKPLSEQAPGVKEALRGKDIAPDESVWPQWTGQQLYEGEVRARTDLEGSAKGDAREAVSKYLLSIGIPGIKYFDAGSRGKNDGTRNLVVFDENLITITHKNGEPVTKAEQKSYLASMRPDTIPDTLEIDASNPDIRFSRVPPGSLAQTLDTLKSNAAPEDPSRATWDAPEPSKMDNVVYALQDKHVDTRRVVEAIRKNSKTLSDEMDAYLQEELFHGRTAKLVDEFQSKELAPLMVRMTMGGIKTADDIQAFEKYLHARHAQERNEQIAKVNPDMQDGGSGMSTKDAQDYLANLDPAMKKQYETLAKVVDDMNAKTRQLLVEYGLESQKTIDAWGAAYKYYVPLQREDMEGGQGTGQGFAVKGSATKRATGSKRAVTDILANIAMQRERAIVRGEKNKVANAVVGMAAANPNEDFWEVDKPPKIRYIDPRTGLVAEAVDPLYKSRENVVTARTPDANGDIVEHSVIFNEGDERAARMAKALKNLDMDQLGEVLGSVAKVTRYFASINTQYNPIFGVVNFTRDTQGAMLNLSTTPIADKKADVLKHTLSALKGIYIYLRDTRAGKEPTSQWAQLFEEFQKDGGQTGYRDMFRTSKDRGDALVKEIKRASEGKPMKMWRAIFEWLSDYNTAMENAVRLASYKVAKESGMSNQRAASLAKNLTVNFNRKGQLATQTGALYAFFNASAQGTARLLETLNGPAGRKIIAGGITLGAVQALALAAAGFDDEEPPDFVKERNLIIPIGDKKYLTLPMPLGLHFIPNLGRIPTELALSGFKNPAKRIGSLFNVFADAFNPVGNAGLSLQTITPTVIDPLAALAENKDWTGKPIARKDFGLNVTPGHTRAKDTASAVSKAVSKGINWVSGGTDYKPGYFSPTPDQIDFLAGQITGGLGREAMKIEQTVSSGFSGEELPPYKIPLAGRFFGDAEAGSSQSGPFYNYLKALNEHEAEIKGRKKHGEPLGDYFQQNPEARLFQYGNMVERRVSELRKQKRALMEKDAPREQILAIEERTKAIMKQFNERVRSVQDRSSLATQ